MKDNIIFFDGECSFCNSTVDFIWKKNKTRTLYYSSLQSDFATDFLKKNDVDEIKLDTIYFYSSGKVFSKTKAFIQVMKELSWPYRFVGMVLKVMPIFIANKFYDVVASNRHAILAKKETCRIPSEEERRYFL